MRLSPLSVFLSPWRCVGIRPDSTTIVDFFNGAAAGEKRSFVQDSIMEYEQAPPLIEQDTQESARVAILVYPVRLQAQTEAIKQ
jgi:hypothetical protein